MKTKMKKTAVVLMSLIMVMCYMPMMAFAGSTPDCDGGENCSHAAAITAEGVTTHYDTLAEAIAAVPGSEASPTTITLINDAEGGVKIGSNGAQNIILDLNEKTYDVKQGVGSTGTETNGMQLLHGSTVVIKNGEVKSSVPINYMLKNYADLSVENVTFDRSNVKLVLIENTGIVTVNEGTEFINTGNQYDISTGNYPTYPDDNIVTSIKGGKIGKVAMETEAWLSNGQEDQGSQKVTTTISGGVIDEVTLWDNPAADDNLVWTLNITGGVIGAMPAKTDIPETGTVLITGGIFSSNPTDYVPTEGFEKYLKGNEYIVLTEGTPAPAHSANMNTWTKNAEGIYVESYVPPYVPTPTPTPTPDDNVTSNPGDKTTTADVETSTGTDGKATATVDKTTADKIVDKAVENKSEEVIIDATTKGDAKAAEVKLPAETVKALVEKTDADVVIKTDAAEVVLDQKAAEAVAEKATTGTVSIVVEKVKEDDSQVQVELKIVTENGNVTDFKGGNAKVT
ncbi:hypothetical protein, partial [Emergencia sp.]|uniref:hypothetical protein n=1 Tax=Emergencia sp. TaxID=1926557 RepID=UPI003AF081B7